LTRNGVPLDTFRQRMHLGAAPAKSVGRQQYGPMRFWVVSYRSVYQLVSFTACSAATCIAPSCRRFRGRCGNVVLARRVTVERRTTDASDAAKDPATKVSKTKPAPAVDASSVPRGPADEEFGIDSDPGDTGRACGDAADATVAARVSRNLLPFLGEVRSGEVWARTAA